MRKRIINQAVSLQPSVEQPWLDLSSLAQVELTSEAIGYPIEAALMPETGSGWRATHSGAQTIRLLFDVPQTINRMQLLFLETAQVRTQEFVLRWSSEPAQSCREFIRQQYNFSLPGREQEDYRVQLADVRVLELYIIPDISGGNACASLAHWRIA